MYRKTVTQSRFIDGSDGNDTSARFNELMLELAEFNPTFEREGNSFWVFFKVEVTPDVEPCETHDDARCLDCPYLMRDLNRFGNIDARKRWGTCGKSGERTNIESRACETYYTLCPAERRRF